VLYLDPDNLVQALELFHKTREERAVDNEINAPSKKKKSNFETEEQKAERNKRS